MNFAKPTVPIAIRKINLNEKSWNESELENNLLIAPPLKESNNHADITLSVVHLIGWPSFPGKFQVEYQA